MQLSFNAAEVEPSSSFDPIPAGTYTAEITDSKEKDTKSGNGSYLELTFSIIEGEFMNRLIWVRLNLKNPNATAVEIAQKDLSAICRATGVMNLTDSSQLHGKPMKVKVSVRKSAEYGDSNEIKSYESADSKTTTATSAPSEKSDRPWS